jgi:MFS family permease
VAGTCQTFQWPAYSASISLMMPKAQYGRANGMMSLIEMGPGVLSPLLAGALLPLIGLMGILLVDVTTFVLAIGALLVVFVPQPPPTAAGRQARGGLLTEGLFGFRYILARPSLLGLQLVFFFGNLFAGLGYTVLAPTILARTCDDEVIFGTVQSVGAAGGILGALAAAFAGLVGTGPGAGMALLMLFTGLASALVGALGYHRAGRARGRVSPAGPRRGRGDHPTQYQFVNSTVNRPRPRIDSTSTSRSNHDLAPHCASKMNAGNRTQT